MLGLGGTELTVLIAVGLLLAAGPIILVIVLRRVVRRIERDD